LDVDYRELQFEHELGRGGFAIVHRVLWRGKRYACKVMKEEIVSEIEEQAFRAEVAIMSKIKPHKVWMNSQRLTEGEK
jgi:predicted Ser/Thr protein kinase